MKQLKQSESSYVLYHAFINFKILVTWNIFSLLPKSTVSEFKVPFPKPKPQPARQSEVKSPDESGVSNQPNLEACESVEKSQEIGESVVKNVPVVPQNKCTKDTVVKKTRESEDEHGFSSQQQQCHMEVVSEVQNEQKEVYSDGKQNGDSQLNKSGPQEKSECQGHSHSNRTASQERSEYQEYSQSNRTVPQEKDESHGHLQSNRTASHEKSKRQGHSQSNRTAPEERSEHHEHSQSNRTASQERNELQGHSQSNRMASQERKSTDLLKSFMDTQGSEEPENKANEVHQSKVLVSDSEKEENEDSCHFATLSQKPVLKTSPKKRKSSVDLELKLLKQQELDTARVKTAKSKTTKGKIRKSKQVVNETVNEETQSCGDAGPPSPSKKPRKSSTEVVVVGLPPLPTKPTGKSKKNPDPLEKDVPLIEKDKAPTKKDQALREKDQAETEKDLAPSEEDLAAAERNLDPTPMELLSKTAADKVSTKRQSGSHSSKDQDTDVNQFIEVETGVPTRVTRSTRTSGKSTFTSDSSKDNENHSNKQKNSKTLKKMASEKGKKRRGKDQKTEEKKESKASKDQASDEEMRNVEHLEENVRQVSNDGASRMLSDNVDEKETLSKQP